MTTLVLKVKHDVPAKLPRRALFLGIAALAVVTGTQQSVELSNIVVSSLSDAYLQVSVFVAATLLLFYGLERGFNIDTKALLQQRTRWQVPLAALLGALPGCGGAIIVVTQYAYGRATFGALLAVLTATMGDAAFLLLAREPLTGIMVFAIGAGAGVVTGWVVDRLHGPEFMRVMPKSNAANPAVCAPSVILASDRILFRLWWLWLIPGVVFGMLEALQIDGDALLASRWIEAPVTLFGAIGALLSLALWLRSGVYRHDNSDNPQPIGAAVLQDTSFVTTWVVLAYLLFGLGVFVTGIDLGALFQAWTPLLPLVAILIGLLPGCGPQIVVTSLYLAGAVPFSAQLGNAISNDGDALFPAMALAPKAALLATFYSAIPALIVAYGYYGIWE